MDLLAFHPLVLEVLAAAEPEQLGQMHQEVVETEELEELVLQHL